MSDVHSSQMPLHSMLYHCIIVFYYILAYSIFYYTLYRIMYIIFILIIFVAFCKVINPIWWKDKERC